MGYYLQKGEAAKNLLILSYKRTAKQKNIFFKLSFSQFFNLTKQNCYYCGRKPYKRVSESWKSRTLNGDYIYNGIDRKDNTKGYTLKNCVPCCSKCNYLKRDLTYREFLYLITKIYNNKIMNNKGL